jgi:WD40 repeat protein
VPADRDRAVQQTEIAGGEVDWGLQFEPGSVLGDRYQIRSLLGCGGMGEVWHAFDLKLRVEVALKGLRPELLADDGRRKSLRSEVRAAREVVSPNVCRIFDLIEVDGQELVSMEYVDGGTLLELLQDRGPLELKEAQDIASQFLAGLEAIHQAGLVHRDVKPENIMITRAGRVVLMDLGLARREDSGAGTVSGTPAYMAPEQGAGLELDARADVYSVGVVLAEMVSPDGIKDLISRQSVWEGIRHEPARVPSSPWAPVLKKAVAKERAKRYNSAHTLTRALEDVTLRVEGAEDLTPYPGLSSFTEEDAEYFFGREGEIEQIWRRLEGAHLLAVVGPSGAGKTSFIGAGLVPNAPAGWAIVRCTPGDAAISSLARAMAREMAGDADAVEMVVGIDDPAVAVELFSRWRRRHDQALLIVDQFEELFTLNSPEVQGRFADLLGRLPLESDVRVLLSMRDDFLMHCNKHEALKPIFSELTPLDPPVGPALRRALVQPATKCGYRFEDDGLVDEMLAEVEGERGALPLLAFAAARLWEKRDRETGLLTRQAYHDIGGVGGALARHAEATIDRIGSDHIAIVRELFRNLVTAEGTRAVRAWDELLSVFDTGEVSRAGIKPAPTKEPLVGAGSTPARETAKEVLHELIDARLLTSYEVHEEDREPTRRVEIIHESLLANWPRLVGWQTQDADSVRMRDELRQAARTWDEHERSDDLLWTGSAYREFSVWRERYPGGLTETEEGFARAMNSLATRRRRRRRIAVAAAFVILLGVLAIIGGFWRRSVTEARRAEAANLFSLAQLQLENHPTATIAYAIASLELADNREVRRLAVEALWLGPTEIRLPTPAFYLYSLDFSADGRWLATADPRGGGASLWPSDGGPPTVLEGEGLDGEIRISPRGDLVAATMSGRRELGLWSFPEGRFLRSFALGDRGHTFVFQFSPDGERLLTYTEISTDDGYELQVRSWPVVGGKPELVARLEAPEESVGVILDMDPSGSRIAWADGREVHVARLEDTKVDLSSAITVEHDRTVTFAGFDAQGQQLVTADRTGAIRIWSLESDPPELTHSPLGGWAGVAEMLMMDNTGSILAAIGGQLWDLTAPPETELLLLRHPEWLLSGLAFDPDGNWLATTVGNNEVSLWPLARGYPRVLRADEGYIGKLAFTPDGQQLVSTSADGWIRVWPLLPSSSDRSRILHRAEGVSEDPRSIAMAPDGSFLVIGSSNGQVVVLPLDGGPVRELGKAADFTRFVGAVAVGPRAHLVAAGSNGLVRLWDLDSGASRVLDAGDRERVGQIEFSENGDLWVASKLTLRRWSLGRGQPLVLEELALGSPEFVSDDLYDIDLVGRKALHRKGDRLWIMDIDTREVRELSSHGRVERCGLHADGELVVSTERTGEVRIGPTTGEEPHLLLGHQYEVNAMAVSPDGRWIATGSDDKTIRLWPMPDFSKPPLHTLPREELIAKLRTLTNLRVVGDPESSTGWKLEVGPFPGWETVPTW